MSKEFAVVILSGGLDSVGSMVVAMEEYDIKLAILFNYGQKAFEKERIAVENVCTHYDIPFKIINLDWLQDITKTALVGTDVKLPEYTQEKLDSDISVLNSSAKAVWVPNRNGVMLNIAASIAESKDCSSVIFGANKEEALTFPDNTKDFADAVTNAFSYSTSNKVKVSVPLFDKDKKEIVSMLVSKNVPLTFLWSCYLSGDKHCGKCESCSRLKRALLSNGLSDIWEVI